MTGWTASLAVHLILAAMFLVTRSGTGIAPPISRTPVGIIENPTVPLITEPLISDLQLAPVTRRPMVAPPPPQLVPPICDPVFPATKPPPPALVSPFPQTRLSIPETSSVPNPYQTSFCGSSATGDNICYVVDCSGSMVVALDYVRRELRRSIHNLNPAQCFQIIFFSGHDPIPMPPPTLLRAASSNILAADQFISRIRLEKVPNSRAAWKSVVDALALAFRVLSETPSSANSSSSKDVIYLLTDGEYDHSQVKLAVDDIQASRSNKVAIHVIACGNQNNEKFLRQLAASYQGSYTFVSDEQLARQRKD